MSVTSIEQKNELANVIHWRITSKCNFKCVFCSSDEGKNSIPITRFNLNKVMKTLSDTNKIWNINFSGGEPLIYPDIVPLCERLSEKYSLAFDTNLSVSSKLRALVKNIPPSKIRFFNVSVHIMERERLGNLSELIDNILFLKKKGYVLRVLYVYYPSLFSRFVEDREYFRARGIEIIPKLFYGMYNGKSYPDANTAKELAFLEKNDPEFKSRVPINSNSLTCDAGKKLFYIDPRGDIFRCPAGGEIIGNICGEINLDKASQPCKHASCKCFTNYIQKTPRNYLLKHFNDSLYKLKL